jgi:hypothetical protein
MGQTCRAIDKGGCGGEAGGMSNIRVSQIKSRAARRAVIVVSFLFVAVAQIFISAWNGLVDAILDQHTLLKSAVDMWRAE